MKKALLVLVALFGCKPAFCQIPGVGGLSIVFDPKETVQVIKILTQARQQMQFMQQQVARMKNMVSQYQAAFAQLQNLNPLDAYGNVGGLATAANYGGDATYGYGKATAPLSPRSLNGLPLDTVRRLKTAYGDVFMSDASNISAWNLIGAVRANAQANSGHLGHLVSDAMSSDTSLSTMQVQQKTNAAAALAVQQLNTLQQVEAAQLEQSVERAQRERNEASEAMATASALQNVPSGAKAAMPNSGIPTLVF
jgi:conjugal transfer/entry exclusion protein